MGAKQNKVPNYSKRIKMKIQSGIRNMKIQSSGKTANLFVTVFNVGEKNELTSNSDQFRNYLLESKKTDDMAIIFLINTPYLEIDSEESEFNEKHKDSDEKMLRHVHQSQICYRNYQKFFEEVYDDWAFFQIANRHYTHVIACKREL